MFFLFRIGVIDCLLMLGEFFKGLCGLDENSRSRTGGYYAEIEFEVEVVSSMNKVMVKLVGVGVEIVVMVYGGGWCIDKLVNRILFYC